MLALTTTNGDQNEIFVYEQFTLEGDKTQLAWSKWILPTNNNIQSIKLTGDRMDVLVVENGNLYLKRLEMYTSVASSTKDELYVDDAIDLTTTDGLTVTMPANYVINADSIVLTTSVGTAYPLQSIKHTVNAQVITFSEDIRTVPGSGTAVVRVGRPFRSAYKPTRPFLYDEDGIAQTVDKIRVNNFVVSVVNTHQLSMLRTATYSDPLTISKSAQVIGQNLRLGVRAFATEDWRFSFKNRAELAEAEFFTDGPYNLTIAGIRWEGQVTQKGKQL
jgi:hypothetical protein